MICEDSQMPILIKGGTIEQLYRKWDLPLKLEDNK